MELYERDFFISRIIAGYVPLVVNKRRFLVYFPDKHVALRANEIYTLAYKRAVRRKLLNDDEVFELLLKYDLWTEERENEYKNIVPKHIEYWKIELYNSILQSKTRDTVRKHLEVAKKELQRLAKIRHSYDHLTCVGYAMYCKNLFIISECTRLRDKKVDWSSYDINKIMHKYHSKLLSSEKIRLLARTQPWSGMWPTFKANRNIFSNEYLTHEQQILISWSTMYDKIYESPDCPPDTVIKDDDMLDGWLLIQQRKRDEERKKQEVQGVVNNKIANADEVFVVAQTQDDADKVDLLNNPQGKRTKRQRLNKLSQQGVVKQQEFKDVQINRSTQMQQAYNKTLKGK